ncbi:MAG: NAD(P)H-dependent oxidoreductase subunit E [Verrucomicrobia bacterium]|nr:NAD(P)H-dependent oxidoreductase subunit E [Verrucomicrobiota bacterium]
MHGPSSSAPARALKPETLAQAPVIIARYPQRRSATMPLLHLVQEDRGHITQEDMHWVAEQVGVAPMQVLEVVTFYPMFRQAAIGRRHVRVCRTLSCALRGSYALMEGLEKALSCPRGETSPDGDFTLEFVECIADCGCGPVVHVDGAMHENVQAEDAEKFAAKLKATLKDPSYGQHPPVPGTPEWNG